MENPPCEERIRLSQAFENAIREVFETRSFLDRALRENEDPRPYTDAVALAERAAHEFETSLDRHRKEHGCG
jgi:hypothetical protein